MITLGGLFAVNAMGLDSPNVAIPGIAEHFGVERGQAQLVTVFFLLGYAIAHIPIGLLGDRFGRRPVILIGLAIAILMSLATVFAPNLEVLLAARFLQGASTCSAGLLSRAIVRDVASGTRASQLTSNSLSVLATLIIVSPLLAGYLMHVSGWRAVLCLVSGYLIVLFILTTALIKETMHTERHSSHPWMQFKQSARAFLNSPQSLLASFLGGIAFGTYFIFSNVGASLVVDAYDLPASLFGALFALAAAVQLVVSIFNSRQVARRGAPAMLRLAAGFSLAGVGLCLYWAAAGGVSLQVMVAIAICFTITHVLVLPNSIALTLDPLPKTAGFAAAIHGMLQTGSAAIVGFVVSFFYDGTAETVLVVYAAFGALTLLTFIVGRKRLLRRSS